MANEITTGESAQSTLVTLIDGVPTTTTREIAEAFGKRHDDVLRIVRQRTDESGDWGVRNFTETVTTRANPSGGAPIESPVIRMTEKGFMFVVQKFTGKKAVATQIKYVDEFERMRNALNGQQTPALPAPTPPAPINADTLVALILGGMLSDKATNDIANAVTKQRFITACKNPHRGYGAEVAARINQSMSWPDLHTINVAASMEVWIRTQAK
jgi:Rha family phage regulatory protein